MTTAHRYDRQANERTYDRMNERFDNVVPFMVIYIFESLFRQMTTNSDN